MSVKSRLILYYKLSKLPLESLFKARNNKEEHLLLLRLQLSFLAPSAIVACATIIEVMRRRGAEKIASKSYIAINVIVILY